MRVILAVWLFAHGTWLLGAVGFSALSVAVWLRTAWWQEATFVALSLSLMLCVLGWPHSRIGVASNTVVASLLATAALFGWV
jgi:hypothetical protein